MFTIAAETWNLLAGPPNQTGELEWIRLAKKAAICAVLALVFIYCSWAHPPTALITRFLALCCTLYPIPDIVTSLWNWFWDSRALAAFLNPGSEPSPSMKEYVVQRPYLLQQVVHRPIDMFPGQTLENIDFPTFRILVLGNFDFWRNDDIKRRFLFPAASHTDRRFLDCILEHRDLSDVQIRELYPYVNEIPRTWVESRNGRVTRAYGEDGEVPTPEIREYLETRPDLLERFGSSHRVDSQGNVLFADKTLDDVSLPILTALARSGFDFFSDEDVKRRFLYPAIQHVEECWLRAIIGNRELSDGEAHFLYTQVRHPSVFCLLAEKTPPTWEQFLSGPLEAMTSPRYEALLRAIIRRMNAQPLTRELNIRIFEFLGTRETCVSARKLLEKLQITRDSFSPGFQHYLFLHKSSLILRDLYLEFGLNINAEDSQGRTAAETIFHEFLEAPDLDTAQDCRRRITHLLEVEGAISRGVDQERLQS